MPEKSKDLGHSEHGRLGSLKFESTWVVYGPFSKNDTVADTNIPTTSAPTAITAGGKTTKGKRIKATEGRVDFNNTFGKHTERRGVFAAVYFTAPRDAAYTIGMGADWWMDAWVDGNKIGSTLESGNGTHPPSKDNHGFKVNLTAGKHLLFMRVLAGMGGHVVAVGNHSYVGCDAAEVSMRQSVGISSVIWRPLKIVFMGAGSGFLQSLVTDVMNLPGAERGELALVDIDPVRLEIAEVLCRKIIDTMGKDWKVTASTDRRKVLKGADYVINCIEVSGVECVRFDNDIPLKYGIDQCIGDTIGPGGVFKALRTVPVFLQVLSDIEKLCPDAWVLNYTNPMSIMCLAAARASKAKVIGLCHSVQAASHALAAWADVPYHEMKWQSAGVNHLAWFTTLRHKGEDLYPRIRKKFETQPDFRKDDKVRKDLMMHFGYYCTESSGHDSEYLPYYRTSPEIMKRYCGDAYEGGSRFYAEHWPTWRKNTDQHRRDIVSGKIPLNTGRSWEYASYIIQALETNDSCVIYGTVVNNGLISNLPQDGVVEVACLCDAQGIQGTHYGKLAGQCAALCDWNMRCFDLAADACINKSIETAAHALMLDPLSAAVSCPADIRKMTLELWKAEKEFLPGFSL